MQRRQCPLCEVTAVSNHHLTIHLKGRRGHGLDEVEARSLAAIATVIEMTVPAVRDGHLEALRMLEDTGTMRATIEAFEQLLGERTILLRPIETGLMAVPLNEELPATYGLGVLSRPLPPSRTRVETMVESVRAKAAAGVRVSAEEAFHRKLLRAAISDELRLRHDWLFLAWEWRLPSGGRPDFIAVDPATRALVVIEAKASEKKAHDVDSKGHDAWGQARRRSDEIALCCDELGPYLTRLARALALLFEADPDALCVDWTVPFKTDVWWP